MKTKLFISMAIVFIGFSVNAQTQPPNGGFENWDSLGVGNYNPTGWSSYNNFSGYGVPILSFKTTDSHSGTYALRVISDTVTLPPPLGSNILDTLPGYVYIGSMNMNNPGIPYNERPLSVSTWFKSTVVPGGAVYLVATLTKWNAINHQRDNVGQAVYPILTSFASYTQVTIPFNYSMSDNPDTLSIQIMGGDPSPTGIVKPHNELIIDDITFNFPIVASGLDNLGFEYWDPIGIGAENPSGWSSFNNFSFYGVPTLTFKSADAHSGSFALRLISDTATLPPPFGSNLLDTVPGYVFIGNANMDNPGIPFNQRPTSVSAWVKGTIAIVNIFYFNVTLSKWNTATSHRDVVGQTMHPITSSVLNYMQITDPFFYALPDLPDTINIQIMCGDPSPSGIVYPGSEFFIDDISFTGLTGISETSNDMKINIFPNPGNGLFNITSNTYISKIEVMNVLGEMIYSVPINSDKAEIDLRKQPKGIYFYQIYNDYKNSETGKIIIK